MYTLANMIGALYVGLALGVVQEYEPDIFWIVICIVFFSYVVGYRHGKV